MARGLSNRGKPPERLPAPSVLCHDLYSKGDDEKEDFLVFRGLALSFPVEVKKTTSPVRHHA